MKRIMCDLHCVRDAIRGGDKAILSTLENAVIALGKYFDDISEYYLGTINDQLRQALMAEPSGFTEIATTKERVLGMFSEMKGLLGGNIHPTGLASAMHALETFKTRVSGLDHRTSSNGSMAALVSDSETLLSHVHGA